MSKGFASVATDAPGINDNISIRDLVISVDPSHPATILLSHLGVMVPVDAFQRLVSAAAGRAGVNATGSLARDRIGVTVSVSLLRFTVTFSPTISNGRLVLTPKSGVPGWLIGRAAPLIGRTAGLSMTPDGRVSVDPAAFLPEPVRLRSGFTSFNVSMERIELSLG